MFREFSAVLTVHDDDDNDGDAHFLMNRLVLTPVLRAARAAQTSSLPRALRAGASSTTTPSRRYASTSSTGPTPANTPPAPSKKTVTPPSPQFEYMLSSLYPGMKADDLAKRVAALYMMTDKPNEIEQVEKKLHSILRGQDFKSVSEKVKRYLKDPPEDLFSTSM